MDFQNSSSNHSQYGGYKSKVKVAWRYEERSKCILERKAQQLGIKNPKKHLKCDLIQLIRE